MVKSTRKLITMRKVLHLGDNIDFFMCVDATIQGLEKRTKKIKERINTTASNSNSNVKTNGNTTKTNRNGKKNNCMDTSSDKGGGDCAQNDLHIRKENLMRKIEYLFIAAQNNAIRTNCIEDKIDNTQRNSNCILYGDGNETVNHISECCKLAQKEYKCRHDWVGKVINKELCKRLKMDQANNWYMRKPESVLENWKFFVQRTVLIWINWKFMLEIFF